LSRIADVLRKHESEILSGWMQNMSSGARRPELIGDAEFREQCTTFIRLLEEGAQPGDFTEISKASWAPTREFLTQMTRTRVQQGFTPTQIATFVFSFKKPLFEQLRKELGDKPMELADETWRSNLMLDELGLYTTELYQTSREEVIRMQQQEMLELSTPVVKLWEGILALPLIGTLDSARTQVVMETLLQKIVETGSAVAIIDITGVPTVDTLVAQHLIKTVTAARLMGADCIISGIRPQIAQTIVHLGVGLGDVTTKASLADAFAVALSRAELTIISKKSQ
jgi:rsbT co-antagonist protein RsbR